MTMHVHTNKGLIELNITTLVAFVLAFRKKADLFYDNSRASEDRMLLIICIHTDCIYTLLFQKYEDPCFVTMHVHPKIS